MDASSFWKSHYDEGGRRHILTKVKTRNDIRSKQMNIILWTVQILLALWNLTGGIYTISNYESLKSAWASDLPKPIWVALGVLQVISAICLVVPKLTPVAAIYLAVNALLGCLLFSKYAGFPGLLWGVVPAVLAAFVAYGRMR
jgi:uncharacterized membrane protein YphA (DoxX/SURF4 family)